MAIENEVKSILKMLGLDEIANSPAFSSIVKQANGLAPELLARTKRGQSMEEAATSMVGSGSVKSALYAVQRDSKDPKTKVAVAKAGSTSRTA